ncbi:LPXTG cell wall anchor domain-containing protein, partial [Streptomyces sp. SID10362]|uniref:LPXTG cell wall anchor domain-containing protein n=2 Tax=unclassified Streptomyces TaxID=2593676 RepID=UPI0013CCB72C
PRAATTQAGAPNDASGAGALPQRTGGTGDSGNAGGSGPASEPQAQGGLAETGSGLGLWPAAVGGVLFAGGCVLLVRSRRRAL